MTLGKLQRYCQRHASQQTNIGQAVHVEALIKEPKNTIGTIDRGFRLILAMSSDYLSGGPSLRCVQRFASYKASAYCRMIDAMVCWYGTTLPAHPCSLALHCIIGPWRIHARADAFPHLSCARVGQLQNRKTQIQKNWRRDGQNLKIRFLRFILQFCLLHSGFLSSVAGQRCRKPCPSFPRASGTRRGKSQNTRDLLLFLNPDPKNTRSRKLPKPRIRRKGHCKPQ